MLIKRLATDRPDELLLARRKWLAQCLKAGVGTVVLTLAGPQIAAGAGIVAVRVWPAEDYTRVTIESDERLAAVHTMVRNPDRLVVDIDGLDLSPTLRELVAKITPNDPYIQSVRVGQNRPRVVRLVFDLKEDIAPQVFTLGPIGQYRNRLVFDLYPVNPPDPLWKLVRETEDKQRRFASTPATEGADSVAGAPSSSEEDAIAALVRQFEDQAKTPATPPLPANPPVAAARPKPPAGSASTQPTQPTPPQAPLAQDRPGKSDPADDPAPSRFKMRRLLTVAIDPGHGGEGPRRDRRRRLAREGRGAADRQAPARQDRRAAQYAGDDDPRRRFLRAAERARAEGAPGQGRPVRVDPCRCLRQAGGARRLGVRAVRARRLELGRALAGQQGRTPPT
ncbi:hypothetical protein OJJOAM_002621 [Cupriavidus sp. H18C1]